jgi:hypothetical protein
MSDERKVLKPSASIRRNCLPQRHDWLVEYEPSSPVWDSSLAGLFIIKGTRVNLPDTGTLILVGAVIVAFVTFVMVYSVIRTRQRRSAYQQLGFAPADPQDHGLTGRLTPYYAQGGAPYRPSNVYKKDKVSGYALYSYDLYVTSKRRGSLYNVLAIICPSLTLPQFAITTPLNAGAMGGLGRALAEKLVRMSHQNPIDYSSNPDFAQNYIVLGKDEAAIRRLLLPEIIDWFASIRAEAGMDLIQIAGVGDLLIWEWQEGRSFGSGPGHQADKLTVSLNRLMTLFELLRTKT